MMQAIHHPAGRLRRQIKDSRYSQLLFVAAATAEFGPETETRKLWPSTACVAVLSPAAAAAVQLSPSSSSTATGYSSREERRQSCGSR